jgi:hypothetical protein
VIYPIRDGIPVRSSKRQCDASLGICAHFLNGTQRRRGRRGFAEDLCGDVQGAP